ncbi:hypothetical protein [Rhodonellum sp.]|uniref:hypothetical protein n=1 Tax=Rhodonellum sp. TaxID=2231180 RepID=UPI002726620E|nr:hypothetical protein [Rhodonellum sp.]MDO9553432.1 hypothetical protein [Rhodonellum sp.]
MKNKYRIFVLSLFGLAAIPSFGQHNFDIELYGGPSYSYFKTQAVSAESDIKFSNLIQPHIGINFLKKIAPNYQMSLQGEYLARRVGFRESGAGYSYENNSSIFNNNFMNLSVGVRRIWEKSNYNLFLQGSVGGIFDRELNDYSFIQPTDIRTKVSMMGRVEAGVQFPIKNNYLVLGVRHQQGFREFENLNFSNDNVQLSLNGSGSFTGLFVGFGINTDMWSKENRKPKDSKKASLDNPWSDGLFVMGAASLRKKDNPINDPTDDFQNVSTSSSLGLGYRWKDFSMEAGYSKFRGRNVFEMISEEGIPVSAYHRKFQVSTIPFTLRYDRHLPFSEKIRFGISFTTHVPVNSNNEGENTMGVSGVRTIDGVGYPYSSEIKGIKTNSKGVFFNSGFYAEMPLFRTSLIAFKASRNYGSPAFDRASVNYQVNGLPKSFENNGTLNGWLLELEYRLPINNLLKK